MWFAQMLTLTLTLKENSSMVFPQQCKLLSPHLTHYHLGENHYER